MKAIILAAGYATRLYPLTVDKPKALLSIAGKPLLNYTIEKIKEVDEIDQIFIVTNNKFAGHFEKWLGEYGEEFSIPIEVLNDNTMSNEDRLGAIGDLWFTIWQKRIDENIFVMAGDSLFDFSLNDVISLFHQKKAAINVGYKLGSLEVAKRFGILELEGDKIVDFIEKPKSPKSDLASLPVYVFPRSYIKKIGEYTKTENSQDAPGNLIQHFHKEGNVYCMVANGRFFDIGVLEDYNKANETWTK